MITKGIIVNKIQDSNKFLVRLPIFESVGNSSEITNTTKLYEATVSYMPGILDAYFPGDIVYIGFEDNDIGRLIILGKLYQGDNVNSASYAKIDKLYVNSSTEINGQLKVNGIDLNIVDEHNQAINNLIAKTTEQGRKIDTFGDWVIEANKDNLVLNFYRLKTLKKEDK